MRMRNQGLLYIGLFVIGGVAAATAQSDALIGPQGVADALAARDVHVPATQIVLPAAVPVRSPNAPLEIVSIEALDNTHSKLRMRCRNSANCLPFYAIVTWKPMPDGAAANHNPGSPLHSAPARTRVPLAPMVRAGDTATLVLEGRNVSIRLPVICLTSGAAGTSVRVTTTDRKHIYRAEVAGPGLLKGGI